MCTPAPSIFNFEKLTSEYHTAIVEKVRKHPKVASNSPTSLLLIGCGGGILAMHLRLFVPCLSSIQVVDLDPVVVDVAVSHFGLAVDEKLSVVVGDGLAHMESLASANQKFDIVILDVNSSDASLGMSCPAPIFLTDSSLRLVSSVLSVPTEGEDKQKQGQDKGLFLLNLVCRSDSLRGEMMGRIKGVFRHVEEHQMEEDVNRVVACSV
eukprot:GILI01016344.1.p1 GENE.GILI01016344.1~~GILI01016344.1.p1  ORF type:complete len:238 (-),score=67.31 GILI01016344.1:165-791(-)